MHSLWAAKVESRMGAAAWAMRRRSGRYTTMTLPAHEFIRRFLTHVLPSGFPHDTSYPSPQLGEVWPSQQQLSPIFQIHGCARISEVESEFDNWAFRIGPGNCAPERLTD